MTGEIDERDGHSARHHIPYCRSGGGARAERIRRRISRRDEECQITVLAILRKGSAKHGDLLARCHIV